MIGGGDTGSDCVGTSNRQGAKSVTQFELLPQPPEQENKPLTWPYWPVKLRTSSSQEEGCERDWAVATKRFEGRNGKVEKLVAARVEWQKGADGQMRMVEMPGTEFEIDADLVLLAMGFLGPVGTGLLEQFGVARDARSNVAANTDDYRTSVDKVFAAGDMRRGQSLVVWAIREGRQCARAVDEFLMGASRAAPLSPSTMSALVTLDLTDWCPTLSPPAQRAAAQALEEGAVLVLPHVDFALTPAERRFLSAAGRMDDRKTSASRAARSKARAETRRISLRSRR